MSYVWKRPASATRLGNPPAKSILLLLADQANENGYSFPSIDFMVNETELNKRTVRRIIQVFIELGIISRVDRGRKATPGIQLNGTLLGTDLRGVFADYFRAAQGKSSGIESGLRDTEEMVSETLYAVSETARTVSETRQRVSETAPPHPHIGRPTIDPLKTHSPYNPPAGKACLIRPARLEELGRIERAMEATMQGSGITSDRIREVIRKVIQAEVDKGEDPATVALAMIQAWQNYTAQGSRLRYRWTAQRFFGEGYWSKPGSWPWDEAVIEAQAQARVGRN